MDIKLIKTTNNKYKLIAKTNNNPALIHLAALLKESNKTSDIKIGIYSIQDKPFCTYKTVYSYISNRTDKMCKKYYYKFIKGSKQLKALKTIKWNKDDADKDILK